METCYTKLFTILWHEGTTEENKMNKNTGETKILSVEQS